MKDLFVLNAGNICLAVCMFPSLIGCGWLEDVEVYEEISRKTYNHPEIRLEDKTSSDNIHGSFPEQVYIKTATQTYSRDFQLCLDDGLIYYKGRSAEIVPAQWELLNGTGLPHSDDKGFIPPKRIEHIVSDIDSIIVISDEGMIYNMLFDDLLVGNPYVWKCEWGFPATRPLFLNDMVLDYRGFAASTRRGDILWYEDIFGNQHHYGTMGLETLCFLTEDGSEIRFTDTGLPADFSRSFLLPERGRFIARNISASGSTIFLINDAGEMYTRLVDFDTMGGDPMFFKYAYEDTGQKAKGSDYSTNFTEWGLPAEDWMKHEEISLSGKARISKYITIMQNGQGNFAREMMVAGLNAEGKTGYYVKQLLDKTWDFIEVTLILPEDSFLDPLLDRENLRGPVQEHAYEGALLVDGKTLALVIDDMPLSEGYCTLDITYNGETAFWRMHPVEIWSYFIRYNPGHDGYPKQFFVTFEQTDEQKYHNSTLSDDFQDLLSDIFYKKELALFASWAEATTDFLHMEIPETMFGDLEFTLVSSDLAQNLPIVSIETGVLTFDRSLLYKIPIFDSFMSTDFTLPEREFSIADKAFIEEFIAKNENLFKLMQTDLQVTDAYDRDASIFRHSYDVADLIATITLLKLVDMPKIKTLTMHMGSIQKWNNRFHSRLHSVRELLYPDFEELLLYRISSYKQLLSAVETDGRARLNPYLQSSFNEYFDMIFLPETINGSSSFFDSHSVVFERLIAQPLFPGFIVTDVNSNSAILVELQNPLESIIVISKNNSREFYFDVIIHDSKGAQNYNGFLEIDSDGLRLVKNSFFGEKIFFESS